jgi:hypothetical protein
VSPRLTWCDGLMFSISRFGGAMNYMWGLQWLVTVDVVKFGRWGGTICVLRTMNDYIGHYICEVG